MSVKKIPPGPMRDMAHATLKELGPYGVTIVTGLPDKTDIYTTYPNEWAMVYIGEGLAKRDPVLQFMINGTGSISWARLRESTTDPIVFDRAAACGLPNGTVVTASRRGKKIATSIAHDAEELNEVALANIKTSLDVFLALLEPVEPTKEPYEVLYFLSNGLTPKDVSALYKMPLRRVVDLRNAAVKSLKANNVEHAVAIGLKVGIL